MRVPRALIQAQPEYGHLGLILKQSSSFLRECRVHTLFPAKKLYFSETTNRNKSTIYGGIFQHHTYDFVKVRMAGSDQPEYVQV